MTKDEYLITDPPLKALTVFAMPERCGAVLTYIFCWLSVFIYV